MKNITDIFFDLDHTLWDFDKNSILAFDKIFSEHHPTIDTNIFIEIYAPINQACWKLYQVDKITKSIRKLTEINLEACQNIDIAVKELRNFKKVKNITDACARINKLENKADNVYDKAVSELFENETDAKNIIKYKEVLSVLESATDKCKNAASVLESIAVKHS